MPLNARPIADQTLDELECVEWGPPTFDSALATNIHRLRRLPLKQYGIEDLRLMIGQQIGLNYLVPRALDHLEAHVLAAGDFYPGDLLASVARLSDGFWATHQILIPRALAAIDAALARVGKVETSEKLPGELRAARARLAALIGDSPAG